MSTSTNASGSKIVFYEDRRDEIVVSFREELQKAGFSVQDEDIARILDKRHQKIVRRSIKTSHQGIDIFMSVSRAFLVNTPL